jgi:hypothetical protein
MVGDFVRLTQDELNRLVDLQVRPGDGLYEKAYAAHLVTGTNQMAQKQLLAARLRSRLSFLQRTTPLHIFVVTLRCEHSCPYCQVSRQSTDRSRFDMSEETAMRSLDIAFASPTARIKIEFQGGDTLAKGLPIASELLHILTGSAGSPSFRHPSVSGAKVLLRRGIRCRRLIVSAFAELLDYRLTLVTLNPSARETISGEAPDRARL